MFQQVEKSRNDLDSILNALLIGAVMSDENGRVLFLNTAARHLFAWSDSEGLAVAWKDLFGLNSDDSFRFEVLSEKPAEGTRPDLRFTSTEAMVVASGSK